MLFKLLLTRKRSVNIVSRVFFNYRIEFVMVQAFGMNGGNITNITILFCCIEDLKQTLICVA